MRKTILAGTVALGGLLLAGCGPQPGYGSGYGYGPSYGYAPPPPQYGGYYGQPAPNPMAQLISGLFSQGGGYGQPFYGPQPYGPRWQ